jgi:hypothetical protein
MSENIVKGWTPQTTDEPRLFRFWKVSTRMYKLLIWADFDGKGRNKNTESFVF